MAKEKNQTPAYSLMNGLANFSYFIAWFRWLVIISQLLATLFMMVQYIWQLVKMGIKITSQLV